MNSFVRNLNPAQVIRLKWKSHKAFLTRRNLSLDKDALQAEPRNQWHPADLYFAHDMTIFKEMHELRAIGSKDEFWHLKRMLSEAISRGYVEQIPVMKPNRWVPDQEWYRDKETGEIYRLDPPGERGGWWDRVDPKDLVAPDEKVH